jgi:glycosyltransferase involved in cell wall biosynthesis
MHWLLQGFQKGAAFLADAACKTMRNRSAAFKSPYCQLSCGDMEFEARSYPPIQGAKFSILIPTWNNLAYLQCCVESLRRHSAYPHQLIVHVNDGQDGTLDWVRAQGIDHTHSPENVGVCHALNAAATLAKTDYIAFFNDDMYALPGWDAVLWQEIASIAHQRWFLSATMIEPRDTGNACVIAPQDFGQDMDAFRESALLSAFRSWPMQDWAGATWPPNVVPRSLWEEVGGYSPEFSPGMSSDPDFSMKLWQAGVRYFKGLGESRAYHFQTKSTGKVVKNNGPLQFSQKWGITQGAFGKYYLRRGKPWNGPLPEAGPRWRIAIARLRARWKGK